ncbi:MAG: thioesterase [Bacteroidales bacterium]|nr:thioesterase [Bacteroidales bacterium]MDY6405768.1 thioesterase [Bacteroidales bacterium]
MKYSYEYEIKYQEVDGRKRLRLFNLENYLLEVAGTVADELGFGIAVLHPRGLTWILTRLSVEMYELPTHCERVRFETWIESNAHMLSTRDFRIYSGDRLIGICKTVWAILDLQKREIVNYFDDPIFENAIDGEVLEMPRVRMTTIPEPTGSMPHKIVYSDIDYNGHCNSCRYLQAMTDAYLPDYYGKKVRLDINYSKEAMLGEEMQIYYLVTDDGVQYQMKNEAGETSCSAKLSFGDF